MSVDQIRDLRNADPFQPFVLNLSDGRSIPVAARELFLIAPSGQTMVVLQPDDRMDIIDSSYVVDVKIKSNGRRRKTKRS